MSANYSVAFREKLKQPELNQVLEAEKVLLAPSRPPLYVWRYEALQDNFGNSLHGDQQNLGHVPGRELTRNFRGLSFLTSHNTL